MVEFLEQQFYDENGNEIDLSYCKDENAILPQVALTPHDTIKLCGNTYKIIKRDFIKDENGKNKMVKIVLREL